MEPRSRTRAPGDGSRASGGIEIGDHGLLLALSGPSGRHLRVLEKELGVGLGMRGNTVHIHGTAPVVALTERVISELLAVLEDGRHLSEAEIGRAARTLREHPEAHLRDIFEDIVLVASQRKMIAPKTVTQQRYVQAIRDSDLVFGVGPAGTGKTYLAMAMAVHALQQRQVKRIMLVRPAVEAGEKLGFLPGDIAEKVNPYLRPLYDALHDMMDMDRAQVLLAKGTIEVAPLAFMRGRTLNDSFVILDEAQNTTVEQMKMFLTRLGFESKAVITGDVTQIDLPEGRRSGLDDALRVLAGIDEIRVVRFSDADVVRHPLVQKIVRAYDARDAERLLSGLDGRNPTDGRPAAEESNIQGQAKAVTTSMTVGEPTADTEHPKLDEGRPVTKDAGGSGSVEGD